MKRWKTFFALKNTAIHKVKCVHCDDTARCTRVHKKPCAGGWRLLLRPFDKHFRFKRKEWTVEEKKIEFTLQIWSLSFQVQHFIFDKSFKLAYFLMNYALWTLNQMGYFLHCINLFVLILCSHFMITFLWVSMRPQQSHKGSIHCLRYEVKWSSASVICHTTWPCITDEASKEGEAH